MKRGLIVKTDFSTGDYQIVSDTVSVNPDTTYVVELSAAVSSGAISVGILDAATNNWIAQSPPIRGRNSLKLLPFVPVGPNGKVIISNNHNTERSAEFDLGPLRVVAVEK